ncbi:MAG TPA: DUF3168 domain-containing protein [Allosphingosinicella sp.]|jgi:hypothetical protein
MTGAARTLQEAAIAALQEGAPGIGGVYDGPPVQAAFPYAVVECGPETDWSHKSGTGRELRLAVTMRDQGERAERLQRLMAEAEQAMAGLPEELAGWRIVTSRFVRSQLVRDARGSGRPATVEAWAGVIEYRVRMLSAAPEG